MSSTYDLGDVVPLGITIKDSNGDLADATTVTCTITLPDGTTEAGTVTHASTGSYTCDYAPATVGRYLVAWAATGTNASALNDVFDVRVGGSQLVSLAEAKAHLQIADTTTTYDDEITRFVDVVTELCESYTGTALYARTVTETHDGGDTVLLLRRLPVVSVTSVVVDGTTQSTDSYAVDTVSGLVRSLAGAIGSDPQDTVVTYRAGRSTVPARARHAALEALRHLWATQRGAMSRASLNGDDYVSGMGWSLPRRVMELLDDLRVSGIG